jgi:hypothetical protein
MKNIWHIEIKADALLYWYSKLTGTNGNAKAAAFYPFLITTNKIHPKMRAYFINHELIHFAQQKEMFIIGGWIFHIFEYFYILCTKGKYGMEGYLLRSTEQEAYDNMFDLDYLNKRKNFNHLRKYWNNKPVIWNEYLKKVLVTEGFPIVYEWTDAPNTIYENHKHQGKVSFSVVDGSVTFSGSINKTVSKWQRFDVPIGIEHSAIVGDQGCAYIVGQEIEGDA